MATPADQVTPLVTRRTLEPLPIPTLPPQVRAVLGARDRGDDRGDARLREADALLEQALGAPVLAALERGVHAHAPVLAAWLDVLGVRAGRADPAELLSHLRRAADALRAALARKRAHRGTAFAGPAIEDAFDDLAIAARAVALHNRRIAVAAAAIARLEPRAVSAPATARARSA